MPTGEQVIAYVRQLHGLPEDAKTDLLIFDGDRNCVLFTGGEASIVTDADVEAWLAKQEVT